MIPEVGQAPPQQRLCALITGEKQAPAQGIGSWIVFIDGLRAVWDIQGRGDRPFLSNSRQRKRDFPTLARVCVYKEVKKKRRAGQRFYTESTEIAEFTEKKGNR